jgi:hypothetical protein
LEYWGVPNEQFEDKRLLNRFPEELLEFLMSEPSNAKPETLNKWREIGPINIIDIIKGSSPEFPVRFDDLVFGKVTSYNFDLYG